MSKQEDMIMNLANAAGTLALMTAQTPQQQQAAQAALQGLSNRAAQIEQKRVEKQQKKAKKNSLINKAGELVGGTVGFAVGGPAGAAIGSGLGRTATGVSTGEDLGDAAVSGLISGGTSYATGKLADLGASALKGATTAGGKEAATKEVISSSAGETPGTGAIQYAEGAEKLAGYQQAAPQSNQAAIEGAYGKELIAGADGSPAYGFKQRLADAITRPETLQGLTGLAQELAAYQTAAPTMSSGLTPLRFEDQQAIRRNVQVDQQLAEEKQFRKDQTAREEQRYQETRQDRQQEAADDREFRRNLMYEEATIQGDRDEAQYIMQKNLMQVEHLNEIDRDIQGAAINMIFDERKFGQQKELEQLRGTVRTEIAQAQAKARSAGDAAKRGDFNGYLREIQTVAEMISPDDPDLQAEAMRGIIEQEMNGVDPDRVRMANQAAFMMSGASAGSNTTGSGVQRNPGQPGQSAGPITRVRIGPDGKRIE